MELIRFAGEDLSDGWQKSLDEYKKSAVLREDFAEAGRMKKLLERSFEGDIMGRTLLQALIVAKESDGPEVVAELHDMLQLHFKSQSSRQSSKEAVEEHSQNGEVGTVELACHPTASEDEKADSSATADSMSLESKQELWKRVWEETWWKAGAEGLSQDERQVYKRARRVFKELVLGQTAAKSRFLARAFKLTLAVSASLTYLMFQVPSPLLCRLASQQHQAEGVLA